MFTIIIPSSSSYSRDDDDDECGTKSITRAAERNARWMCFYWFWIRDEVANDIFERREKDHLEQRQ